MIAEYKKLRKFDFNTPILTSKEIIKNEVIEFDAKLFSYGRLASLVAQSISGKDKLTFSFHERATKKIVINNFDKINIKRKLTWFRHSQWVGNHKTLIFDINNSDLSYRWFQKTVRLMLPKIKTFNNKKLPIQLNFSNGTTIK